MELDQVNGVRPMSLNLSLWSAVMIWGTHCCGCCAVRCCGVLLPIHFYCQVLTNCYNFILCAFWLLEPQNTEPSVMSVIITSISSCCCKWAEGKSSLINYLNFGESHSGDSLLFPGDLKYASFLRKRMQPQPKWGRRRRGSMERTQAWPGSLWNAGTKAWNHH